MNFYRYTYVEYVGIDDYGDYFSQTSPKLIIVLSTYSLHKETKMGYWITYGNMPSLNPRGARWIPKVSKSRFVYPTKEEAMVNFIARTKRRAHILEWQMKCCKTAISLAKTMKLI